jgi:hypothetical protein
MGWGGREGCTVGPRGRRPARNHGSASPSSGARSSGLPGPSLQGRSGCRDGGSCLPRTRGTLRRDPAGLFPSRGGSRAPSVKGREATECRGFRVPRPGRAAWRGFIGPHRPFPQGSPAHGRVSRSPAGLPHWRRRLRTGAGWTKGTPTRAGVAWIATRWSRRPSWPRVALLKHDGGVEDGQVAARQHGVWRRRGGYRGAGKTRVRGSSGSPERDCGARRASSDPAARPHRKDRAHRARRGGVCGWLRRRGGRAGGPREAPPSPGGRRTSRAAAVAPWSIGTPGFGCGLGALLLLWGLALGRRRPRARG